MLLRRYLVPLFGGTRVADIARADMQRWFDSMSGTPGNANRGLPVLSVLSVKMRQAELWDLRPQGSNPCRDMRRYRLKPRERFLSPDELKGSVSSSTMPRIGKPPPRSGCCCSPARGLRRLRGSGGTGYAAPAHPHTRSKTGPRNVWLGPEAARLVEALPRRDNGRVFPEDLTAQRLHSFWVGIRGEAELLGVRIHNCRHIWASQGLMNGVGLTTVGWLLGHRKRRTTAIYDHLDDASLRHAAAQAAGVIAEAMEYGAEPPLKTDEAPAATSDGESLAPHGKDAPRTISLPHEFLLGKAWKVSNLTGRNPTMERQTVFAAPDCT